MNFFNYLFNKSKIKMDKLHVYIALAKFYSEFKDEGRLEAVIKRINKEVESLGIKLPEEESTKDPKKPDVNLVDKNTPGSDKKQDVKKPEVKKEPEQKAEEKPEVEITEDEEEENESLIEIAPFHNVSVDNNKKIKKIPMFPPRTFKVFTTKEAKVAANNAYPTEAEFDDAIQYAWDMSSTGSSNKELVKYLQSEIGVYYPELKTDSDWYGKVVNPLVGCMQLIKAAFGYNVKDKTITVTRPTEEGLILTKENDLYVEEKSEIKEEEESPKELKTTQAGKVMDEEAQENEEVPEEEIPEEDTTKEDIPEGEDEFATTRDTNKPPEVNLFAKFNNLEKAIFEKYLEGAETATGIKDDAGKKAVQIEKRDESRALIASFYEDEPWVENVDGRWNPLLLGYHNKIVSQITTNRANWRK